MNGFFLIDKQKGVTSFDVVRQVRRRFLVKKVGHSGTLDPLATGLMILGLGKGTKYLHFLLGADKEYDVLARFGAVTETYDADSLPRPVSGRVCSENEVQSAMVGLTGAIQQLPPKYSALKIKGMRAADIVRRGGEVDLKPRNIRIYKFEMLDFKWPDVNFRVECGSGTYVRSLIHDLGQKLWCGAYVLELKRTRIDRFALDRAKKVDDISEKDLISVEDMIKFQS